MRCENWPARLYHALKKVEGEVFSWGDCDCFYWTNEVVEAITGRDNMREFFSKRDFTPDRPYMTSKGMKRTIKNLGFASFFEIICAMYGEPIGPLLAQRGDLLMTRLHNYEALGVCRGLDVMFKTREGNIFMALSDCKYAWRVV